MDFIRNLFTLFQRLQDIVREGQKRRDLPGMVMAGLREVRGGGTDETGGEGDGPALYQGRRAQADQATPEAASRATARNKASNNVDLPEPAVYRSPEGTDAMAGLEPARAPARNADDPDENTPQPATATPLQREDYDFEPASASSDDTAIETKFEPAQVPPSEPIDSAHETDATAVAWDDEQDDSEKTAAVPESATADAQPVEKVSDAPPAEDKKDDEDWFDLDDWQGTALKVAGLGAAAAGTAAGAMAIKNHFFDEEDDDGKKPALPLGEGAEPTALSDDDRDDVNGREWAAAASVAAPAVAAVLPKADDAGEADDRSDTADASQRSGSETASEPSSQVRRPHPVEIIPADPRNPATQPASQTLASPGIRLYGAMDAGMYAEFTEMLAEQEPGGPIVIALTTMEGDPEIARSMADDIRLLRDRGRREIIFLGKTAVYSAGVLFMAAFPVSHRYLTRATKVLITENKRAQPLELAGGSLRSVASQLEHAQREIQREIEQEDEDYRAISEGSNVSIQELREKAPGDWYITASEAKAMGLIAEVV